MRLGHRFANPELLSHALTHRSWCAENPGHSSNERLEFLGDAVLGLTVADHLYQTHPGLAEGEMAKIRAAVVSAEALTEVAIELDIGSCLLLGKGESTSGGAQKPSILADTMEAIIGAVYLDGGIEPAHKLVLTAFERRIVGAVDGPGGSDYKTTLQELAVQKFASVPVYKVRAEGPDHQKMFKAQVILGGKTMGRGTGSSKKQAEQHAADEACGVLLAAPTTESNRQPATSGEGSE